MATSSTTSPNNVNCNAMMTYINWIQNQLIEEFKEMNRRIILERRTIRQHENWKLEYENELFRSSDIFEQDMLRMHIRHTENSISNSLGNIDIFENDYEEMKYNVNWEVDIIKRILNPQHVYEEFDPIDNLN